MKFGKLLLQAAASSTPHIEEDEWLNYKLLKKELKALYGTEDGELHVAESGTRDNKELCKLGSGKRFFKLVQGELRRTTESFKNHERKALFEFTQFLRVVDMLQQKSLPRTEKSPTVAEKSPTVEAQESTRSLRSKTSSSIKSCSATSGQDVKQRETLDDTMHDEVKQSSDPKETTILLLNLCIKLHESLLLVANFAVLNYCGFTKILKKHDKVTGFKTKEKFMSNIVAKSPLAQQSIINAAIDRVETEFKKLQQLDENPDHDTDLDSANLTSSGSSNIKRTRSNLSSGTATTLRKEGLDLLATLAAAERNQERGPNTLASSAALATSGSDEDSDNSTPQKRALHHVADGIEAKRPKTLET